MVDTTLDLYPSPALGWFQERHFRQLYKLFEILLKQWFCVYMPVYAKHIVCLIEPVPRYKRDIIDCCSPVNNGNIIYILAPCRALRHILLFSMFSR